MSAQDFRKTVEEIIMDVAPDTQPSSLSGDVSFREALGLDSMDFLSIIEKIAEQTGVEIPEANYPDVESLDGMCAFLAEHT